MALHIPTGFRIDNYPLIEVESLLDHIRLTTKMLSRHLFACRYQEIMVSAVDDAITGSAETGERSAISAADKAWHQIISETSDVKRIPTNLDFRCDLKLFLNEGSVFGYCDAKTGQFYSLILSTAGAREYHYSEAIAHSPDNKSEHEAWDWRRATWTKVLVSGLGPLSISLVSLSDYLEKPVIKPYAPNLEDGNTNIDRRIRRSAFKMLYQDISSREPDMASGDVISRTMLEVDDYILSHGDSIEAVLPKSISAEMFDAPLRDLTRKSSAPSMTSSM